jgi:hypothetical protein
VPLAVAALVCVTGCVTEVKPSTPAREKASFTKPSRPVGIEPEQMLLTASAPNDADGNGFPDTIPVTIYLFGDTRRYRLPIAEQGTFDFTVTTRDGREVGRWIFSEDETRLAQGDSPAGVCYRFALRLGPGRDRFRSVPVSLRAIFTNAKTGQQVASLSSATIRLGMGESAP